MPKKVRELKVILRKAGFSSRPGKGSHIVWAHPALSETLTLAGNNGDDAKRYQEKRVQQLLAKLKEAQQ
jgi:predicted RNA binding protein YcfA (HicA-like mRNA interferase family)